MKRNRDKGFTMTELMVVLAVMAVILAIGIPAAYRYIKKAEFRKNEENAKTVYMAAETMLTYYRSSGQWDDFKKEVIRHGMKNESFADTDKQKDRIYAITLDRGEYGAEDSDDSRLVSRLLGDLTYDNEMLSSGAVALEIDVDAGQVYAAFYATRCQSLDYADEDKTGSGGKILTMYQRDYKSRADRLLGYYSVEDVANVVDLDPTRLKITSLNLINGETLSLNWSSNSRHNNLDVRFLIHFYQADTGKRLFSTIVDPGALREEGWSGISGAVNNLARLELTAAGEDLEDAEAGTDTDVSLGEWDFPVTYENGTVSLVLDAMMSADVMSAFNKAGLEDNMKLELAKSSDVSITRLAAEPHLANASLDTPQEIYATVQAEATYVNMDGDDREYKGSAAVRSNEANTMYADGARMQNGTLQADIMMFRHLSNMRYCDSGQNAVFTLKNKKLDWDSVGVGLYGYVLETETAAPEAAQKIAWKSNSRRLEFPSVPLLPANHTLCGEHGTKIANLNLGTESVITDTRADDLAKDADGIVQGAPAYTEYVGLFCEAEGTIQNLVFENPSLIFAKMNGDGNTAEEVEDYGHIRGIGIAAGRAQGIMEDITIAAGNAETEILTALLPDRTGASAGEEAGKTAGIGGIAGVFAKENEDGSLEALQGTEAKADNLSVAGVVKAHIPAPGKTASANGEKETENSGSVETEAENYQCGIGGIAGYADAGNGFCFTQCKNHADVSGNMFTGGVCGRMNGSYRSGESAELQRSISDCFNDGLILCTDGYQPEDHKMEGRYFGGILGFGQRVLIDRAASASGRASGFRYDVSEKEKLLRGQYVGGIIGYGTSSKLYSCNTQRNGYVLGSDYVGGIAGGMEKPEETPEDNVIDAGTALTTNGGYVIGNTYVGGIVGCNEGENTIADCVNNGVAAGYDKYIGGITGYNGSSSKVSNCASYVSDYSGSIFSMIRKWETDGDYTGGLVGYNNGAVYFDKNSEKHNVKSVSGIVAGRNYVGGVIGFNDENGTMDTEYALIGGRVYASGDCAGGGIGFNASNSILAKKIEIKPQSVQGRYYVGGCIGANVVDLQSGTASETDVVMDGFRTNSPLGSLTARAFAGGIVGYQRTYVKEQLGTYDSMLSYLNEGGKERLLPVLDERNIPVTDEENGFIRSENKKTLIITDWNNTGGKFNTASSNLPIRAQAFAGGIVGACEDNSKLVIRNCRNSGGLALADAKARDGRGVNIAVWLKNAGYAEASEEIDGAETSHMIGGIIGINGRNHIIDHCTNSGNMTEVLGLGGIVGLNEGGIFNCELSGSFGNAALDVVGGIAGLNVGDKTVQKEYKDVNGTELKFTPGTIRNNRCAANITVTGKSVVGGIAGYNLLDGMLTDNSSYSNVVSYGNDAGGIAGRNAGQISVSEDTSFGMRNITGRSGEGIGGIVGRNEARGALTVSGTGTAAVTAVNGSVTVRGRQYVGGIVGINEGIFGTSGGQTLVCSAAEVRAYAGYAGGIAGKTTKNMINAVNASGQVSADTGLAGGIVPENQAGSELINCHSKGNVNSNHGYAGGITAENSGIIRSCTVGDGVTVRSRNVGECGAVTAVNESGAEIYASTLNGKITLDGNGKIFGGLAGLNKGKIYGTADGRNSASKAVLANMPAVKSSASALTVGGAAGINEQLIQYVTAEGSFIGFGGYRCLGGIAGENRQSADIADCSYSGKMTEKTSAAGNCYGGITGDNSGTLSRCSVTNIEMTLEGVYTATSTSTAAQKEQMATHAGGIAGKNEMTGVIEECVLICGSESQITAKNGMLGGVAGYNKGSIVSSGDKTFAEQLADKNKVKNIEDMSALNGAKADAYYVNWQTGGVGSATYNGNSQSVTKDRMRIIMSTNGNLGGITAYNAPTGQVVRSASGSWFLNNQSQAIGVGTGGMIGMNESERDQSYLLNQAFVGRQLQSGITDRFAGGIIGNQNNTTTSGWKIENCVNFGTVYCYNTHYSGGILGQWTGTGGTIESCRNYGNLQTTFGTGWLGASGGIVAQLYHAYENNDYNIISCGNFGNIYGRTGRTGVDASNKENSANDSAGILGNVTNYDSAEAAKSQRYTIRVLDCVNGPGVEIYSGSMASGIVGFFSCDNPGSVSISNATANTKLVIERCRNFADILKGKPNNGFVGGIFGDRYDRNGTIERQNTVLYDNFSVNPTSEHYAKPDFPIISLSTGDSIKNMTAGRNYYFERYGRTSNNNRNYKYTGSFALNTTTGIPVLYERTSGQKGTGVTLQNNIGASLQRASSNRVYVIRNGTAGKFILAELDAGKELVPANAVIDTGKKPAELLNSNARVGSVLCELDPATFNINANLNQTYTDVDKIIVRNDPFYKMVRDRYRSIEGVNDAGTQLFAPASADVDVADGKLQLKVTPQKQNDTAYDPFKYEVGLLPLNGRFPDDIIPAGCIYEEEGSAAIPAGVSGKLAVYVRSVSMFDGTDGSSSIAPSAWIKAGSDLADSLILPAPDIRAELVKDGTNYRYVFTLANSEDYEETVFGKNWKVTLAFTGGTRSELNSDNKYTLTLPGQTNIQQIVAQAVPVPSTDVNAPKLTESVEVSVSAYMPQYTPMITIDAPSGSTPDNNASVNCEVSGSTLDDLAVTVTLSAPNSDLVHTPPIYRVELTGTWKKGTDEERTDTVFASKDVLISARGSASAVFTDMKEYMRNVSDIRVRVWYAESGLGPVYTWHEVKVPDGTKPTDNLSGVNIYTLQDVTESKADDGTESTAESWSYAFSTVLANNTKTKVSTNRAADFNDYAYLSAADLFTWLPAPELLDVKDGRGPLLAPKYRQDGSLYYTFCWDAKPSDQFRATNEYEVKLYGIDSSEDGQADNRVAISTEGIKIQPENVDINGKSYTAYAIDVDADDWNFEEVEIQVTRIGTGSAIGLTSSGIFRVRQRLPRPEQPSVVNRNSDELDYEIGWEGIMPEDGCGSYEVYVREVGSTKAPECLTDADNPVTSGRDFYQITAALDKYAGKTVQIYVVAAAVADSEKYVNSREGVNHELTVLERIGIPNVSMSVNWEYDRSKPLTMAGYADGIAEGGGQDAADKKGTLTVKVQAEKDSIPPGGSTYLMRAYVFDTEKNAEAARTKLANGEALDASQTGYMDAYPRQSQTAAAEAMDALTPTEYEHTITGLSTDYAGKWLVLQTRISAGDGNVSSGWLTHTATVRLPYVKLNQTDILSGTEKMKLPAAVSVNPDIEPVQKEWMSGQTGFTWDSVKHADTYYISITERPKKAGEAPVLHEIRIRETTAFKAGAITPSPAIAADQKVTDVDGTESWKQILVFFPDEADGEPVLLDDPDEPDPDKKNCYGRTIESYYRDRVGAVYYYTARLASALRAVPDADGRTYHYTLILPDTEGFADETAFAIAGTRYELTQMISFRADLEKESDAYVSSDEKTVDLTK